MMFCQVFPVETPCFAGFQLGVLHSFAIPQNNGLQFQTQRSKITPLTRFIFPPTDVVWLNSYKVRPPSDMFVDL